MTKSEAVFLRPSAGGATKRERAAHAIVDTLDSDVFRALAEPVRLEVVKALVVLGPSDITQIAAKLPQDRSVLSRHLQTLLRAGIVSCSKDGRRRIYSLAPGQLLGRLEDMLSAVRGLVALCCPPK